MGRDFSYHPYRTRLKVSKAKAGPAYQREVKSKRSSEFLHEQAVRLRQRVSFYFGLIVAAYLFYFLFYSHYFTVSNFNLSGNFNQPQEEIIGVVKQALAEKRRWLIFPQSNYFWLSKKKLQDDFQAAYVLDELAIDKDWPNSLNLTLVDRVGQILLKGENNLYLADPDGLITREIPGKDMVNTALPTVNIHPSSTLPVLNENWLSKEMARAILEIYNDFAKYELPGVEIAGFKVDEPKENLLKIVTKQGPEIHLDIKASLNEQFYKLKRSLAAGKIDLSKAQYINLRVADQVIYK